ncbi:MAG: efflux RND transporter periplasmic adaptor subunit [Ruminococcus sp.]|nr:efflux RND transporter periplasmic adaptor subunit [Ruminococcus sp.]
MDKNHILRKISLFSTSAALLLAAASCGAKPLALDNTVVTYTAETQDIENFISVSGSVEGSNMVKITSDLNTKVQSLNVEVGSIVKKGDVLCVFDSSDLQQEYDALKESLSNSDQRSQTQHEINQRALNNAKADKTSTLDQAQRAIDKAVEARDSAYSKYDQLQTKVNDLYVKSVDLYNAVYAGGGEDELTYQQYLSAQQQYETAQAEYEALGEQLSSYDSAVTEAQDAYNVAERSADAAIQAAQDVINAEKFDSDSSVQNQLDKLQERLNKCEVTAPRDGIVTALSVAEGSIPTTDAIMTIEDAGSLHINVTVNEADILNVKEGQKAVITATATGDKEFTGKVSRVVNISSQGVNPYTGESTNNGYTAEISLDPSDSQLLIGMNAKVKIILDEKKDVIAVPYDSIIEDKDGSCYVFVAEDNGGTYTAKKLTVKKGLETNYLTEIVSSDIKDGDLIITEPRYVSDGQTVSIEAQYEDNSGDGE